MAKRPAYTLLLIKSDLIARADFGALPQLAPLGFWEHAQASNARIYNSVEAALELGGKCGREVWVIGEGFWTQTLSLPAAALSGLNRDQIIKAIGFDVEALTGLSHGESALGFSRAALADESEYLWVTQVPLAARTQIQTAVEGAGATLAGILHPGGLPAPLDARFDAADSTMTWRRIEVWKDATLCMTGRGSASQRLAVINGDPAQDAWRANLARWMNSNPAGHSEWLGPHGSMAGEALGGEIPWRTLPGLTGGALQSWLGGWASRLCSDAGAIPVVEPGKAPAFQKRQLIAAALITIACLAGCIVRGTWLAGQRQDAAKAIEAVQSSAARLHQLDDKANALRAALAEKQKRPAEPAHPATPQAPDIERQRHRFEALLAALAQCANENLLVDHIAPGNEGEVIVEGKCLPSTAVDGYARKLAGILPPAGWEIGPAEKGPVTGTPGSGACSFKLRVKPAASGGTAPPARVVPAPTLVRGVE